MFGQIPDFNDGLEFLRKMWGNAAGMPAGMMPGLQAMTPPMDLDEIDKRIHDLKAVESWLQLNINLLRTTIQGLEVQRATLVALTTFGNALSPEAMQHAMENVARAANAPSAASRRPQHGPAPGAEGIDAQDLADMAEMEAAPDMPADVPTDVSDVPPDDEGAEREAAEGESAAQGAAGALPPQANLWWDMVQQQFKQIASGAAAASLASLGNLGAFGGAGQAGGAAQPGTDASGDNGPGSGSSRGSGSGPTRGTARTGGTAGGAAKRPARKSASQSAAPDRPGQPSKPAAAKRNGTGAQPGGTRRARSSRKA